MSIIHVNQIKTHVKRIFDGHIDLQDPEPPNVVERSRLSDQSRI